MLEELITHGNPRHEGPSSYSLGELTMNPEQLNQQFEPIYRANPDAVNSYLKGITDLVLDAMDRQTGVCSYEDLFNEIHPLMPNAADLGIGPALADNLAQMMIEKTVDYRSRPLPDADAELAMLNKIIETMKQHGLKTAGEAIAYLHKQQIN